MTINLGVKRIGKGFPPAEPVKTTVPRQEKGFARFSARDRGFQVDSPAISDGVVSNLKTVFRSRIVQVLSKSKNTVRNSSGSLLASDGESMAQREWQTES